MAPILLKLIVMLRWFSVKTFATFLLCCSELHKFSLSLWINRIRLDVGNGKTFIDFGDPGEPQTESWFYLIKCRFWNILFIDICLVQHFYRKSVLINGALHIMIYVGNGHESWLNWIYPFILRLIKVLLHYGCRICS